MHCFGLSMMKLTWLSLLKFSTPLTVYVWQNHIHVVHYHTLKVIVYKINNCIYLNYKEMNGIKVITLMRERLHATENLVIIHNCGFIGNLRSSFTMNSFQSLTYYSEFLPSFHVLLTSYAVLIFLLCLSTFFCHHETPSLVSTTSFCFLPSLSLHSSSRNLRLLLSIIQ